MPMSEAINEIMKEILSIKEQLKELESIKKELSKKADFEVKPELIDELVKHTTKCPACRKAMEDALNKYYEAVKIGRAGKEGKGKRSKGG